MKFLEGTTCMKFFQWITKLCLSRCCVSSEANNEWITWLVVSYVI